MEKGRACTIPSGTGEGTHWRADSALEDDGSLCICSSVASPEARRLRECAAAELSSSENQSDPRPPGLHATPPSGHLWGSPPPGRSLRIGPPRSPSRRLRREDAGELQPPHPRCPACMASPLVPALSDLGRKPGSVEPGSGQSGSPVDEKFPELIVRHLM